MLGTDPRRSGRSLSATLLIGGSLLIGCGIVEVVGSFDSGLGPSPWTWVSWALFAAGITLFALGVGRGGSIVARRPMGIGAMVAFAFAPWLLMVAFSFVPGGPVPGIALFLLVQLVAFVSGLVAVIEIIRARVLRPIWRQVPLWAFILATLAEVAEELHYFYGATTWYWEVVSVDVIAALPLVVPGIILALGVLAVLLGARSLPSESEVGDTERHPVGAG